MNYKALILTTTAVSLMGLSAAQADATVKSTSQMKAEAATSGNIVEDAKDAWKDMKHDLKEAGDAIGDGVVELKEDLIPTQDVQKTAASATDLMGVDVFDQNHKKVGSLKDLIINEDGDVTHIIVSDNDIPGFEGKLVAIPYEIVNVDPASTDVIAPISESMISNAKEFSYDDDASATIVTIPSGMYAVSEIMDGDVTSPTGEKLGTVEDIYVKDGNADTLIIGFDKTLGMGGKTIAANIEPTKLLPKDGEVNVALSAQQTSELKTYQKANSK